MWKRSSEDDIYKGAKIQCWEVEGKMGPKKGLLLNGRYLKIKDEKKRHHIAICINNPTKLYILNSLSQKLVCFLIFANTVFLPFFVTCWNALLRMPRDFCSSAHCVLNLDMVRDNHPFTTGVEGL